MIYVGLFCFVIFLMLHLIIKGWLRYRGRKNLEESASNSHSQKEIMSLFRSNNHRSRQGGSSNRWWTPGAPEHTPVSFRAGILEMDEAMVKPIESPGVLYVTLNSETNLPVLCWKNRNSGNVDKVVFFAIALLLSLLFIKKNEIIVTYFKEGPTILLTCITHI